MTVISVVDCDIGNVGSVMNMLKHIQAEARLVSTPAEISSADALLLPGVGHFGHAMSRLAERDLVKPLRDRVMADRKPILGICLGMQLLGMGSDEGNAEGLGFIDARFERFEPGPGRPELKVPHMGWNVVKVQRENPLISSQGEKRFYFVHSYRAVCRNPDEVIATSVYGDEFCCAYGHEKVYGVQFHPEKSHRYGMELFRNFVASVC